MAYKIFFSALASVLFVQAAYTQCIGNLGPYGYGNTLSYGNLNPGNIINAGAAVISNNNLGVISNNLGLIGSSYTAPGAGSYEVFTVNSGSPAYQIPAGVAVTSENQLAGQVAVGGALPFLGSAYFGGEVLSGGEGVLTYSAGPSVSLNGGGCQGAGIYNNELVGLGGASVINGYGGSAVNNGLSAFIGGYPCNQGRYL